MKLIDLHAKKFGNLLVLDRDRGKWYCKCDCGKYTWATGAHLRAGNRTSCGCLKIKPKGEASFNDLYSRYKYRAEKVLGVAFELTKAKFKAITSKPCLYCGSKPEKQMVSRGTRRGKKKRYNGSYTFNGIDRVENSTGYVIGNVVPCCEICNKAKRDMSHAEFEKWILRLVKYQLGS